MRTVAEEFARTRFWKANLCEGVGRPVGLVVVARNLSANLTTSRIDSSRRPTMKDGYFRDGSQ
jgi:hypothetical protein